MRVDPQDRRAGHGAAKFTDDLFVGRGEELELLTGQLAEALGQQSSAVLVRGEAGMGKSVLLRETLSDLSPRATILDLHPDELGREIPYASLADSVALLSDYDDRDVAQLASELEGALVEGTAAGSCYGPAVRLFSALQDKAPTVVAVDDLHLIDDDTLVLLSGLLRRTERHPLVLLGTLRHPDAPMHGALALLLENLDRDHLLRTFDLRPLGQPDIDSIVEAVVGVAPEPELARMIEQQSGGNPFFVMQTLLELVESDAVEVIGARCRARQGTAELSPDRRSAVLQRVLRIGRSARQLAGSIALLGTVPLERVEMAADLAGLGADEGPAAFDALVERGLLVLDGHGASFCHGLLRDALYQSLRPAERWRMHRGAADRLAQLPQTREVEREVAHHVAEVAEYGDDVAIEVLAREADRACRAGPRTSISWYERALSITPPERPQHAELMGRMARALFLAARPQDAADAGRDALSRMERSPARERLALLVVDALNEISAVDEAARLIDEERAAGPPQLRLAAQAAHVLGTAGRLDDATEAATEARSLIGTASPTDQIYALAHLSVYCMLAGRSHELAELWTMMKAAADGAPLTARLSAYVSMSYVFATQGESDACSEAIGRAQELLAESGLGLFRAELATAQALNAYHLGDWETVLDIADSMESELDEAGSLTYLNALRELKVTVLANQGRWPAARKVIAVDAPTQGTFAASKISTLAELDRTAGELDVAIGRLQQHLVTQRTPVGLRAMLLALLADMQADAGQMAGALATLAELDQLDVASVDPITRILSTMTAGRTRADADLLRTAIKLADANSLAMLQAKARLFLGTLGVDTEENLRDAIRMFHGVGATPWRRRAAAELRSRGLQVPRHRAATSTFLTETESQVARLVQLGRPNREIALTVCLSIKTVEAHLTRIYAKTNTANRLELALALEKGTFS